MVVAFVSQLIVGQTLAFVTHSLRHKQPHQPGGTIPPPEAGPRGLFLPYSHILITLLHLQKFSPFLDSLLLFFYAVSLFFNVL